MSGLGPRDPEIARYYGQPRPGFLCGACGRDTATFDAGRREWTNPSGIIVITPRRVCRVCLSGIIDGPIPGESFDATFPPEDHASAAGDGPDGACTGK